MPFVLVPPFGYDDARPLLQASASLIVAARDVQAGTPALLKLASPSAGEAFAQEHELLRSLAVPGLARPTALREGPQAGAAMVLEPFVGEPMAPTLPARPMPWRDALRVARSVASTLSGLHAAHIAHLDLRPANLLVDWARRETLLVDLHVAATRAPRSPEWADPAVAAFLAPEQCGGLQREVDHRADLYALGTLMYRLLAGRLPFEVGDALEWMHCHVARAPQPPSAHAPMPRGVSDIVTRLLAKPPDDRYQSAAALLFDLDLCILGTDTEADALNVGTHNARARLRVPRTLHGRQAERQALEAAFQRVRSAGRSELVLISGEAGSGKSTLAHGLRPLVAAENGRFAAGKFDPHGAETPHAAFAQAFAELVKGVLGEPNAGLAAWRERLMRAVGPNAQLMVQLVPPLGHVLGAQPTVPTLPPREAELRFHLVFQQFVATFTAERPLVLFIDDLQWADRGSLAWLRELLQAPIGAVMLVGAYREQTAQASQPLLALADEARRAGRLCTIELGPLDDDALRTLVADAVGASPAQAAPLAASIGERTGGNPLFATQFLLELVDEGALRRDDAAGRWTWDTQAIAAKGYARNVVELLLAQLQRLPPPTLRALQHAACLGHTFAPPLLAAALGVSRADAEAAMAPALEAGLALRVGDGWRFVHDRLQEAAYSLIQASQRPGLRLQMGRLLVRSLSPEALEERLFDVVSALNEGAALIDEAGELALLRRLNIRAGAKAKAAADGAAAYRFFQRARQLLPADAWSADYAECFEVRAQLAECAFLTGAMDEAQALLGQMLERAQTIVDRARAYSLRIGLLTTSGHAPEGAAVALDALRSLGLALPEDEAGVEQALRTLDDALHERLAGGPLQGLLALPRTDDPGVVALMALLNDAAPTLFIARPDLWPAAAAQVVTLSLAHGHSAESSFGYQLLADLYAGRQDLARAAAFAALATRLDEQFFPRSRVRHRLLMHQGTFVQHWLQPYSACRDLLQRGVVEALEHGDAWLAGNCMLFDLILALEQGEPLDHLVALARRPQAFVQRPQLVMLVWTVRLVVQTARCLQGLTRGPTSFDDEGFSEAELTIAFQRRGTRSGPLMWHVMRQMVYFLAGQPQKALQEARQAAALLDANEARPFITTHHLFHLLARTSLFDASDAAAQQATRQALAEMLPRFEAWARACPANQQSRWALLRAELARIEGRDDEAARAYEEALQAAHRHGNRQVAVVAGELAARFHAARGLAIAAGAYLRQASEACASWGAHGLRRELQARHPQLAGRLPPAPDAAALAIAKASQAMAGPMDIERLPEALMRIAMEAAGAEHGVLLLAESGELHVVAQARVSASGIAVQGRQDGVPDALPWSVAHYVARSCEPAVLSDAGLPHAFSTDPYLLRERPRSVLCLPLLRGAELVGVLYMEHALVDEAFPPERVQLLATLAAQAAISLETSRLYASLQERQARIRRLVDANIIGIRFAHADGHIFEANDAYLQLLGRTREDLNAGLLNTGTITPPEYHAAEQRATEQLAADGRYAPYEKEYQRPDGTRVPVLCGGTWLDPAQRSTVGFVLDLSERRQAETERAARRAAELANRAKSEFLANMSHELRTPLNGILGYAQLLQLDGGLNEAQRRGVDIIRQSGDHLLALINDILDLSRIEAGRLELAPAPVQLAPFLRAVCDVVRVKAEQKRLGFNFAAGPGLPAAVVVDERRLRQVLLNLLSNAVKFTEHGSVTLRVSAQPVRGDQVRLRLNVEDTGVGISADHQQLVYEPFEQVGDTRHRAAGTGLGLTITRALVQAMGGAIALHSAPGRGCTFSVELSVMSADALGTPSLPEPHLARYRGPRRRVLVVDDVPANRALLVDFLGGAGFDIAEAINGADALRAVAAFRPDLVVVDSVMPVMDGLEFTRRLRAQPDSAGLPIIAISASATEAHRRECVEAGVNSFLSKPVQLSQLLAAIAEYLRLEWESR